MNNETPAVPPQVPPQTPPQGPPQTPPDVPPEPPVPEDTTSDTETENTNPDTNSDTSSQNDSECCNDYPCPPQPEPEKCEPYYVPMTMQLCPVVKLFVNKPKVCLVNKAECIPCFLEKK